MSIWGCLDHTRVDVLHDVRKRSKLYASSDSTSLRTAWQTSTHTAHDVDVVCHKQNEFFECATFCV